MERTVKKNVTRYPSRHPPPITSHPLPVTCYSPPATRGKDLPHVLSEWKQTCGHTILKYQVKKKYKSEGKFSQVKKLLMTCVILAWKEPHIEKTLGIHALIWRKKSYPAFCTRPCVSHTPRFSPDPAFSTPRDPDSASSTKPASLCYVIHFGLFGTSIYDLKNFVCVLFTCCEKCTDLFCLKWILHLPQNFIWSSIKGGTWNIPEHSGTSRNILEHRIIMIITDWWNYSYLSIAFFHGDAYFTKLYNSITL